MYTFKTHTHTRVEFRCDQLANCIRHMLYNEPQAPPLSEGNPQPPPRWGLIQLTQFTTTISLSTRHITEPSQLLNHRLSPYMLVEGTKVDTSLTILVLALTTTLVFSELLMSLQESRASGFSGYPGGVLCI